MSCINRIHEIESSARTIDFEKYEKRWEDHLYEIDQERIKRGKRPLFS